MRGLIALIKAIFRIISTWRPYIPKAFAVIFLSIRFMYDISHYGLLPALQMLSKELLVAEQNIHNMVTLAINNDPSYNLIAFLSIINSLIILYYFIKFLTKVLIGITGSQAHWGAMVVATVIVGLIEIVTLKVVDGTFGFIPIKDGILYLIFNINPVLSNIHYFSFLAKPQGEEIVNVVENITTNYTGVQNGTI